MPTFSIDLSGALDFAFALVGALWGAYAIPLSIILGFSILALVYSLMSNVFRARGGSGDE